MPCRFQASAVREMATYPSRHHLRKGPARRTPGESPVHPEALSRPQRRRDHAHLREHDLARQPRPGAASSADLPLRWPTASIIYDWRKTCWGFLEFGGALRDAGLEMDVELPQLGFASKRGACAALLAMMSFAWPASGRSGRCRRALPPPLAPIRSAVRRNVVIPAASRAPPPKFGLSAPPGPHGCPQAGSPICGPGI